MKIKLSLWTLESRENPSGAPVDEVVVLPPEVPPAVDVAPPAANAGLTDSEIVYGDGVLWFYDENPLIIPVSDITGPQITNPDFIIGGDENDVIVSDEIQVIVTPPAPPENDSVLIIDE